MVDIYGPFIHRTVTKVRQLGYDETADQLEQNKPKFKQYLRENNWTEADLTSQWTIEDDDYLHVYGKITDGMLKNTNGIHINPI